MIVKSVQLSIKMIKAKNITINIPNSVLNSIYKECDKYNVDETGGRLIGFYKQDKKKLEINVAGEIGPGPNAQRNPTYFLQDGAFQEEVFRSVEEKYLNIEHLGNWHTHHVNGYPTLSGGDLTTYIKTVNHSNHNTDFFYALLVVSKNHDSENPYEIKHFVLLRGTTSFIEIPKSNVKVTNDLTLWVGEQNKLSETGSYKSTTNQIENLNKIRFYDQLNISKLYPTLKPGYSKEHGFYWKGKIMFIKDLAADILLLETSSDEGIYYSVALLKGDFISKAIHNAYAKLSFESATQALVSLERDLYRDF